MKKFIALLLVLMMVLPIIPTTFAQDDAILTRLEEYNTNLPQGYGLLSVDDLFVKLTEEDVFLLDVRQPEEYEAGHIEGSVSIPIRDLGKNLNVLPSLDANIVVICKGGFRAIIASTGLQILGYTNVQTLKGGYDAWVGEEYPISTEPTVVEPGDIPAIDGTLLTALDDFYANLPQGWGAVTATDLATELIENPPLLIDVRSEEEWNTGYIEGAQHIWINDFMAMQDQWPADKDANIVVYCASSYRGGIAYVILTLMGYTNVRNLSGGISAWIVADLPIVGAPETPIEAELDIETLFADYLATLPASFNAVRVSDLETKLAEGGDFLLVDVRTADEYAEGFIEGAINIPLQDLTQNLNLLPNLDQEIIIYCGSGHRSSLAMIALNLLGYTNAQSLLGGTNAWMNSSLPLSTTPVEYTAGTAPTFDPNVFALVDEYIKNIPAGYYMVKAADLNTELIENAPILIDVRTDGEWADGHLESAIHIELRNFMTSMAMWPEDKTANIVVYEAGTHRSAMALTLLRLMGYENVRSLAGGTGAWTSAGFSLVQ